MIAALLILFLAAEIATVLLMQAAGMRAAQRAYQDGLDDAADQVLRRWQVEARRIETEAAASRWTTTEPLAE